MKKRAHERCMTMTQIKLTLHIPLETRLCRCQQKVFNDSSVVAIQLNKNNKAVCFFRSIENNLDEHLFHICFIFVFVSGK